MITYSALIMSRTLQALGTLLPTDRADLNYVQVLVHDCPVAPLEARVTNGVIAASIRPLAKPTPQLDKVWEFASEDRNRMHGWGRKPPESRYARKPDGPQIFPILFDMELIRNESDWRPKRSVDLNRNIRLDIGPDGHVKFHFPNGSTLGEVPVGSTINVPGFPVYKATVETDSLTGVNLGVMERVCTIMNRFFRQKGRTLAIRAAKQGKGFGFEAPMMVDACHPDLGDVHLDVAPARL